MPGSSWRTLLNFPEGAPCSTEMNGIRSGGYGGVSFQADNYLSGGFWDGTKFRHIIVQAPQRKVARMTGLLCACPVTDVQAMGAVRVTGLYWVAVLKRDPPCPRLAQRLTI
jgi:hypothetical protein